MRRGPASPFYSSKLSTYSSSPPSLKLTLQRVEFTANIASMVDRQNVTDSPFGEAHSVVINLHRKNDVFRLRYFDSSILQHFAE